MDSSADERGLFTYSGGDQDEQRAVGVDFVSWDVMNLVWIRVRVVLFYFATCASRTMANAFSHTSVVPAGRSFAATAPSPDKWRTTRTAFLAGRSCGVRKGSGSDGASDDCSAWRRAARRRPSMVVYGRMRRRLALRRRATRPMVIISE